MSVQVEQPTSSIDLSVISASIDGGYTSEEALYSIDSKRFDDFKSTIKTVKFKDRIEVHEHEETSFPNAQCKRDPSELFDIFNSREINPSPQNFSEEDSDDFHINRKTLSRFELASAEIAIEAIDSNNEDAQAFTETETKNYSDDSEEIIEEVEDVAKYDITNNDTNFYAHVELFSPDIENLVSVEHIETIEDTTSFSDNNNKTLRNTGELEIIIDSPTEENTAGSVTLKDLQTNGIHESELISTKQNLYAQQGELVDSNSGSGAESVTSSIVEHIVKNWKRKVESQKTSVNRLKKEIKTIKASKLVQDKIIKGYAKSNKDYQIENDVIQKNYDLCLQRNKELSLQVQKLSHDLRTARIESTLISKFNEANNPLMQNGIESAVVSSEKSFERIKSTMQTMLLRNDFLYQALIFVTNKVNNLYRYTLSPILFLLDEGQQSLDVLPTFDSGNEIQTFIDSNSALFNRVFDINQSSDIVDANSFEKNGTILLKNLDKYFDELNDLIACKLESVIRQQ